MTAAIAVSAPHAEACSRVIYQGVDSLFVIGRSLDWKTLSQQTYTFIQEE